MKTPICEKLGIEYPIFAFTPSEHVAAVFRPSRSASARYSMAMVRHEPFRVAK